MTELDPATADLVKRLRDTQQRINELQEHETALKSALRAALQPGEYTAHGQKAVTVTVQRRFNPTQAQQVLPPEMLALCTVHKVDAAAAKKVLPPALYAACSVEAGEAVIRLA